MHKHAFLLGKKQSSPPSRALLREATNRSVVTTVAYDPLQDRLNQADIFLLSSLSKAGQTLVKSRSASQREMKRGSRSNAHSNAGILDFLLGADFLLEQKNIVFDLLMRIIHIPALQARQRNKDSSSIDLWLAVRLFSPVLFLLDA